MKPDHTYLALVIVVMSGVTFFTRALPFVVGPRLAKFRLLPRITQNLPPAIMTLLVMYSIKDVSWTEAPYGLPELMAMAVVILLHLVKGNALLSIGGGTALYMVLTRAG